MRYALGIGMMLVLAGLTWLGLQVSAPSVEADESTQPHFTFSTAADQRVLTVRTWGGMSLGEHEYILWGDGRFQQVVRKTPRGRVISEQVTTLEFVEMNDLVSLVVNGKLVEWDEEDVATRIRQAISGDLNIDRGGQLFAPSDASWKEVTINLDTYQGESGEKQAPASVSFSYPWSPRHFKEVFKPGFEVPEVDALIALGRELGARFPRGKRK